MHAQTQSRQPKRIIAEPVDSVRYLITVHFKEERSCPPRRFPLTDFFFFNNNDVSINYYSSSLLVTSLIFLIYFFVKKKNKGRLPSHLFL